MLMPPTRAPRRRSLFLLATACTALFGGCAANEVTTTASQLPRAEQGAVGQWRLQQVAGRALPVVVDSFVTEVGGQPFATRVRIDSAVVSVNSAGSWEQSIFTSGRSGPVDGADLTAVYAAVFRDAGQWRASDDQLLFSNAIGTSVTSATVTGIGVMPIVSLQMQSLPTIGGGAVALHFTRMDTPQ
jgi:hypothetical protein